MSVAGGGTTNHCIQRVVNVFLGAHLTLARFCPGSFLAIDRLPILLILTLINCEFVSGHPNNGLCCHSRSSCQKQLLQYVWPRAVFRVDVPCPCTGVQGPYT